MSLLQVISNIVHVSSGPRAPELGVELLGRFDEVPCQVGLVHMLDLVQV